MLLVFDVDGVIADTDSAAVKRFGPCDRSIYSWFERWPDKAAEVQAFTDDPQTYERLYPIAGAQMMLRALREFGFKLVYATARPGGMAMRDETITWLKCFEIPHDDVCVVPFADKANLVHSLGPIAVFEDSPEQVAAMRAKGLNVVVYDQPWNRQMNEGPRALDWADVFAWVIDARKRNETMNSEQLFQLSRKGGNNTLLSTRAYHIARHAGCVSDDGSVDKQKLLGLLKTGEIYFTRGAGRKIVKELCAFVAS